MIFFGTKGYMIVPDYSSYRVFYGPKREPGPLAHAPGEPMMDLEHFQNWVAAIRTAQCPPKRVFRPRALASFTPPKECIYLPLCDLVGGAYASHNATTV